MFSKLVWWLRESSHQREMDRLQAMKSNHGEPQPFLCHWDVAFWGGKQYLATTKAASPSQDFWPYKYQPNFHIQGTRCLHRRRLGLMLHPTLPRIILSGRGGVPGSTSEFCLTFLKMESWRLFNHSPSFHFRMSGTNCICVLP